jgi:hypothetical protein
VKEIKTNNWECRAMHKCVVCKNWNWPVAEPVKLVEAAVERAVDHNRRQLAMDEVRGVLEHIDRKVLE